MRILILSYYFPPFNGIGPVRVGKTAKYLSKFGHDVRIITAKDQPYQANLRLEVEQDKVIYTSKFDVNKPVALTFGKRGEYGTIEHELGNVSRWLLKQTRGCYRYLYRSVISFPDEQIGWFPYAYRAACRLLEGWKPDVMYASALPYTSLLLGYRLSRKFCIPWVAELRDLWTDHHHNPYPFWRRWVEAHLERTVLQTAVGLVTVSEPLKETLQKKYRKPTAVILNGFDPDDYPTSQRPVMHDHRLRIVYTGMIYEGRQDPSLLFSALLKLGPLAEQVRVVFWGRYLGATRDLAKEMGVEPFTEFLSEVPYHESLQHQREADILLLLLWNDPSSPGVYTGKLFEYIGARRPILAVGPYRDVAADLIERRGAGCVLYHVESIAGQIRTWIEQKHQTGFVPTLPESVSAGLSRESQTRCLEQFLFERLATAEN